MDGRFTDEELAIAKSVDLCAVAESLGYTVKRIGKYHTLKEMDSIRIYNRSHWYRWSRQFDKGNNGGSQIDFLRVFCGMSVKEAVFWLLDFAGYRRIENPVKQPLVHQVSKKQTEERKPFVLPEPAGDNSYLISYLNQERGISRAVIDLFLKEGLIYESRHYHNVVFRGNDKNGVTRFASMRGVFDKQGKPFKCDVTGNDKNYGFNVVNENSTELVVFEAAIDLNYMEGHDYAIGIDSDGKMYRQDIAEENGEIEPYSIDDVIDIVCEWNYELILDAEAHRSDPKDFNDYNEYQNKYESLKADEKRLDRLFDKTSYGKELIEVATELADRVIAQLGNKELEKAAVTVAEGVREYSTGKRGR